MKRLPREKFGNEHCFGLIAHLSLLWSIGWVALSFLVRSCVRPAMVTCFPSPPLPSSSPPPSPFLVTPVTLVSPVTPINPFTPITPWPRWGRGGSKEMFDQKNSSENGLKWRDNWSNNQKVTWTAFPILAIFSFNSLPYPFAFYISISRSRLITLSFYLSIFQYLEASRCLCLCQPPECGLARHTSNNSKIPTTKK